MSDIQTLGPWLERYLSEHIVTERNLSPHTQKSYRDTFTQLLPFVSSKVRKPVDRLAVRDLTTKRVLQFLAHVEDDRGCSIQTRNQRLTAIRAFARFVGSRDPAQRLIPLLPVRLDIDVRNATVSAGGLRKSQRSPCLIRAFQQWEGTQHHALPEPRG